MRTELTFFLCRKTTDYECLAAKVCDTLWRLGIVFLHNFGGFVTIYNVMNEYTFISLKIVFGNETISIKYILHLS